MTSVKLPLVVIDSDYLKFLLSCNLTQLTKEGEKNGEKKYFDVFTVQFSSGRQVGNPTLQSVWLCQSEEDFFPFFFFLDIRISSLLLHLDLKNIPAFTLSSPSLYPPHSLPRANFSE